VSTDSDRELVVEPGLGLPRRVPDANSQHEPIELRLGQGECAREIVGILRRDDEEGLGQGERLTVDGDLSLVHRLEERALRAGRCAIDLVGEQDVREDGALSQRELTASLIVDRHADHIGGQEVARELHAAHLAAERLCERAGERRLADAGHVFDEKMPARKQRNEGELDDLGLALQRGLEVFPQSHQHRERRGQRAKRLHDRTSVARVDADSSIPLGKNCEGDRARRCLVCPELVRS
jgi:hypothetical protein